jgi:pilus assembly protein CpaC
MGSTGDFGVDSRGLRVWPERRKQEIGRIASIAMCGILTSAAMIGAARATDPVASANFERVAYLHAGAVDTAVENNDGSRSAAPGHLPSDALPGQAAALGKAKNGLVSAVSAGLERISYVATSETTRSAEESGRNGRLRAEGQSREGAAGSRQNAPGTINSGPLSAVTAGLERVAYVATGATGMASIGKLDGSDSAARPAEQAGRNGRLRAEGQSREAAAVSRKNTSGAASNGLISAVTAGLKRFTRLFDDAATTNSLQNAPKKSNPTALPAILARPENVVHLEETATNVTLTAEPKEKESAGNRPAELPKQGTASRRDPAAEVSVSMASGEPVGAGVVHFAAATSGPSIHKLPILVASAPAEVVSEISARPRSSYQLAPDSRERAANSDPAAPIRVAQIQNQNQRRSFGVIVTEDAMPQRVVVTVNKSRTFRSDRPFKTAAVGSSDIVDLQPMTDRILYVQGKKVGTTNVSIFDEDSVLIGILDVEVTPDTANLREKIRAGTGATDIRVSSANGQIVLTGMAADATVADRVFSVASGMAGSTQIINAMQVASPQQVMLEVRFLEASRGAGRELGVNLEAWGKSGRGIQTGFGSRHKLPTAPNPELPNPIAPIVNVAGTLLSGSPPFGSALARLFTVNGTNVDALISALEDKGLVRKLAEPNLIALSGDKASFLAGGEFPVPIPSETSGGTASTKVEFKRFGVELEFTPTVLSKGQINLQIAPSVSELDHSSSVRIGDILVPGLTKRTARTTVELRDGQSFAIAGLLQSSNRRNTAQVPWIGSVPVLGALFRSAEFQQEETDLVIIVTPRLVQPAAPGQRLASPLDSRLPSNDVDFFLNGQPEVKKRYFDYVTAGGQVEGPYGHMIEPEHGHVSVSTARKAVSGK